MWYDYYVVWFMSVVRTIVHVGTFLLPILYRISYHTVKSFGGKKLGKILRITAICQVVLLIFTISIALPIVSHLSVAHKH